MTLIRVHDRAFHTTARNNPTARWEWQSKPPASINKGGQMHGRSNKFAVVREEAFHLSVGLRMGISCGFFLRLQAGRGIGRLRINGCVGGGKLVRHMCGARYLQVAMVSDQVAYLGGLHC